MGLRPVWLAVAAGAAMAAAEGGGFFVTESDLQAGLTTLDDGRIVVLAPSWDVGRHRWFHNMLSLVARRKLRQKLEARR